MLMLLKLSFCSLQIDLSEGNWAAKRGDSMLVFGWVFAVAVHLRLRKSERVVGV
jgi:hypothetical protein